MELLIENNIFFRNCYKTKFPNSCHNDCAVGDNFATALG